MLYRAIGDEHNSAARDTHAQAHLGAIDAALAAADAVLVVAACQVDAGTDCARAELIARRARAVVEPPWKKRSSEPDAHWALRRWYWMPNTLAGRRSDHLCTAEPRRTRPRRAWTIGRAVTAAGSTGNGARLAARPVADGGTPVADWMAWDRAFPELA